MCVSIARLTRTYAAKGNKNIGRYKIRWETNLITKNYCVILSIRTLYGKMKTDDKIDDYQTSSRNVEG
jgi:hypothetical protein